MASARLDFRAATLDIYANPGSDITWRIQITDEGITAGTITVDVGGQTPTVDTSLSIEGMLIADITLTDTQTTTLGAGSFTWSFKNTVAGTTTTYLVGNVTITTSGNSSNGLQALVTATSGTATVQTLVSNGAATAVANHLSDTTDAHDASAVSVLDSAGYFTGTDTEAALAELGLSRTAAALRTGNRTIIIGDSIAASTTTSSGYGGWLNEACSRSALRLRLVRNSGTSGNTSTQMLARFAADVTAHHPDVVVIAAVTPNDVTAAIPMATRKANIQAMVALAIADNSNVILATSAPHDTAATKNELVLMNHWLIGYANSIGVPVFDIYSVLADPADGTYVSAYAFDSTHPTAAARLLQGAAAAAQIPAQYVAPPFLTVSAGDSANLLANGVFVGDANADGVADSWTTFGTSTRALNTLTGGVGNWQEVTYSSGYADVRQSITTGWSAGDVLALAARIQKDSGVSAGVAIKFNNVSASGIGLIGGAGDAIADTFVGYQEFTIPVGTTTLELDLFVQTSAGTAKFGQVTLRNLTTLGLV